MLQQRVDDWHKLYETKLAEAIRLHPTQYHNCDAKDIAAKALVTLTTRGLRAITINAFGWKSAAKALKIPNTYKAWEDWLDGKDIAI